MSDRNAPNKNPASSYTSSKSNEGNSVRNNFDSDDTDADPNFFVDSPSSESSKSSRSDLESDGGIVDSKNMLGKRKIAFPCNGENKSRKRKKNVQKWQKNVSKLLRNKR